MHKLKCCSKSPFLSKIMAYSNNVWCGGVISPAYWVVDLITAEQLGRSRSRTHHVAHISLLLLVMALPLAYSLISLLSHFRLSILPSFSFFLSPRYIHQNTNSFGHKVTLIILLYTCTLCIIIFFSFLKRVLATCSGTDSNNWSWKQSQNVTCPFE